MLRRMTDFNVGDSAGMQAVRDGRRQIEVALRINRQARDQLGGLGLMFLLGMAVNLIGLPSEVTGSARTVTAVLLGFHILVAVGLLAGSVVTVLRARASSFLGRAAIGLVTVAVTFLCGAVTASTGDARWSYAMSVGFIAGLWIYGALYVRTRVDR